MFSVFCSAQRGLIFPSRTFYKNHCTFISPRFQPTWTRPPPGHIFAGKPRGRLAVYNIMGKTLSRQQHFSPPCPKVKNSFPSLKTLQPPTRPRSEERHCRCYYTPTYVRTYVHNMMLVPLLLPLLCRRQSEAGKREESRRRFGGKQVQQVGRRRRRR